MPDPATEEILSAREATKHVSTVTVRDPDSGNLVEVEIRKCVESGAMVGLDGSYLEQDVDVVRNPYNPGLLLVPDDEAPAAVKLPIEVALLSNLTREQLIALEIACREQMDRTEPTEYERTMVEQAHAQYHRAGEVEIDPAAVTIVSESADGGAYVQAWVWVDDPELESDPE